jgi:hypothetical protein
MKQTIVRSVIIAFGLFCVAVIGLIVFGGDTNHFEELDSLSARINADPTPENLRDLLNYPADGEYSYYQMALTGALFSKHPEVFESVSKNIQTDQERSGVELLARLGTGVFEYYPEIKPADFDQQFIDQTWLQQHGEQAGAGQPAIRTESDSYGSDKPQLESEGRSR